MLQVDKINNIKSEFPSILVECMGIVSAACKKAGISRETYYNWHKLDPEFRASIDAIEPATHGFVEDTLKLLIGEKNPSAVFFYLKTKCKHLGYEESPRNIIDKYPGNQFISSEYKAEEDDVSIMEEYKMSITKSEDEMKVVSE